MGFHGREFHRLAFGHTLGGEVPVERLQQGGHAGHAEFGVIQHDFQDWAMLGALRVPSAWSVTLDGEAEAEQEEELILEPGQLTGQLDHYLPNHWLKANAMKKAFQAKQQLADWDEMIVNAFNLLTRAELDDEWTGKGISQVRKIVAAFRMETELNAIAATPEGGAVRLRARPAAGGVEIRVEDDGQGVPEALRERVFEPFFSTHPERPGGLGLAISRRLAERAGGSVEVAGAGHGCFRVWLPEAPADQDTASSHSET